MLVCSKSFTFPNFQSPFNIVYSFVLAHLMMSSFEMALYSKGANEHNHECILMWSNQRLIVADESSLSSRSTVIWYLIDIRSLAYTCSKIRIDSLEFDMLKSWAYDNNKQCNENNIDVLVKLDEPLNGYRKYTLKFSYWKSSPVSVFIIVIIGKSKPCWVKVIW